MKDSSTRHARTHAENEPQADGPTVELRVDPPHTRSLAHTEIDPQDVAANAAMSSVLDLAQLRLHATQLAGHLDSVRENLDRRESELNARVAETESQLRAARLWLQERDEEHVARGAGLEHRQQAVLLEEQRVAAEQRDVEEKLADLACREAAVADAHAQLARREQATERTIAEVARQRQEILSSIHTQQQRIDRQNLAAHAMRHQLLHSAERRHIAVEEAYQRRLAQARLVAQEAFQDEYQRASVTLDARQRALEDAEALLADAQQQLRRGQEDLVDARRRHEEQSRIEREGLARRQRELDDAWQCRQQTLAARSGQLDQRHEAVEETRRKVLLLHRESLELRLASEELWAKLSEASPAPGLELSLGRIRDRLAENYSLEKHAGDEQRKQLDSLHARLSDQYARLSHEKQELQTWVERRQQEIENQAARLCTREQELDRQDEAHERARRQWDEERQAYQAEIRSLLAQQRQLAAR